MALGSMFGGFWDQVGRQVGVKLALKSDKMGYRKKSEKQVGIGNQFLGPREAMSQKTSPP